MHSTKRLYFPDLEEPIYHKGGLIPKQYDKYPIVDIPIPPKEPKTLSQLYDEFVAQQRLEKPFLEAWFKFIALKKRSYGL